MTTASYAPRGCCGWEDLHARRQGSICLSSQPVSVLQVQNQQRKRLLKAPQMNSPDLEEATVIRTKENNANMKWKRLLPSKPSRSWFIFSKDRCCHKMMGNNIHTIIPLLWTIEHKSLNTNIWRGSCCWRKWGNQPFQNIYRISTFKCRRQ